MSESPSYTKPDFDFASGESSKTPDHLQDIIDECVITYGINPLFIYDQFTGRPLGRLNEMDLAFIVLERQFDLTDESDRTECALEFAKRTCYSVRPSVLTNYLRKDSMTMMLKHRPVELFAYLYNRLTEPADRHATRRGKLEENHRFLIQSRIAFWNQLNSSSYNIEKLKDCLTPMLGLDVEFNSAHICSAFYLQFDEANVPDFESLRERFQQNLHERKMGKVFEKKQARRYANQSGGNSASAGAYASSFWDRKPPSKKAVAKTAKRKQQLKIRNKVSGILSGLLDGKPIDKAKPHKSPKSVSLTGALMAGVKAESEGDES